MYTAQTSLFEKNQLSDLEKISGLEVIADYISQEDEGFLIQSINNQPWLSDLKRRVQHYGWRYDYKARQVDASLRIGVLPDWLTSYADNLYNEKYFSILPDQIIVNEYLSGQGISPHIDCVPCFTDTIASISLGSACIMDFTHSKTNEKFSVLLEPRSLLVMKGDARYLWKHSIAARKTDTIDGLILKREKRISLTFRKVLLPLSV